MDVNLVNAILNGGALTILGYWILWGLPRTLKDVNDLHAALVRELLADHKATRESNERSRSELALVVAKLAESIAGSCHFVGK